MIRLGVDGRELQSGTRTGIGRYVSEVVRAADHAGWECLVYVTDAMSIQSDISRRSLRIVKESWTPWWDQVMLPRQLTRDGITIFLSPYYKGPIYAPCPVVITIHDLLFIQYPGRRRRMYDLIMTGLASLYGRSARAIITDSCFSKGCIVERLGVEQTHVHVIPLAVSPVFKPSGVSTSLKEKYDLQHPYILYVGNFKPHKNLERLLQAFSRLDASVKNAHHLVLAGQDSRHQKTLELLSHRLGIAHLVRFPGFIPDEELPKLYSNALCSVLPSVIEGFGLTALESMACGCPVMASNRASIPEVVGEAGVLFNPEQIESMTQAMMQFLTSPSLRLRCRQKGLVRAGQFNQQATTGRVLTLLQEIQKGKGMRGSQFMEQSSGSGHEWH